MKLLLVSTFLMLSPLFAHADDSAAKPDWLRFSLKNKGPLAEIYQNSIAESIFVKSKQTTFLPPIQYFSRPAKGAVEAEAAIIRDEIAKSLGVNLKSKSTLRMKNGAFKGGPNKDLPGWSMEYQSSDGQQTYVTCFAVVKEKDKIHAVFVQAFQTSLPQCSQNVVDLARSADLLAPP